LSYNGELNHDDTTDTTKSQTRGLYLKLFVVLVVLVVSSW